MSKFKIIFLISILLVLIVSASFLHFILPPIKYWVRQPANFEECVEASNAVILTLPRKCEFRGQLFIDQSQGKTGILNRPYTTGGPLDTGLAEVKIISVNGEIAYLEVGKIRDYNRYPGATYPELKQGDKLDVRIFHFASATSTEASKQAQKVGDPNPPTPQTQPDIGKIYLGDMHLCIKDYIGGLSCEYEGWSAGLYPL